MESADILDVRRYKTRTIDKKVAIDQSQVDVVNEFWNRKLIRKSIPDIFFRSSGLLQLKQAVTYVKNEVGDSLNEIHPGSESGKESGHDRRRVEDGGVHDLAAVEAEAPVGRDGNPKRSCKSQAAFIGYQVYNYLKEKNNAVNLRYTEYFFTVLPSANSQTADFWLLSL